MMRKILLLLLILLLLFSSIASAEERIVNGGFETGNFSGWTIGYIYGGSMSITSINSHSGTYSYYTHFGSSPGQTNLHQNVDFTDVPTLTFWAKTQYDNPVINVRIDGGSIYIVYPPSSWTKYNVDVSSYSGVHNLQFGCGLDSDWLFIDDVSAFSTSPSITSYSNSITNNESTTINGEIDVDITFNITTDQPIITYDWHKDGVNQNNNNDELTTSFSSGNHTLSVNGTNANGTSNTITWNIINPNTISIEIHSSISSTFINDEDSTGGFIDNNGYITLTPTIATSYPLTIEANLYEGIKLTFISSDTIPSIPLTLTGLNPSQDYAIYESGTFQYEFRSTSPNYFYDITTHDEISSFELVKLSAGGGGNDGEDNNEDEEEDNDTGIIIIDDIIFIETDIEEEFLVLFLEDPIRTITTFLSQPTNWLILLGAYIGVYIGIFLTSSKVNYFTILFYGTIIILIILIIAALGLNLLFLNIIFSSSSFILAFITYTFYGTLVGLITGD